MANMRVTVVQPGGWPAPAARGTAAAAAPEAAPRHGGSRATWQQQRAAGLLDAGFLPCAQAVLALTGAPAAGALDRALAHLTARHPILRDAAWSACDLRLVPPGAATRLRARIQRDNRRVIAREIAGRVLGLTLLRLRQPDDYEWIVTLSGRVADAPTLRIVCDELLADAFGTFAASPAFSYESVVEWERALRTDEDQEEGRLFWALASRSHDEAAPPFARSVPIARPYDASFVAIGSPHVDLDGLSARIEARRSGLAIWLLAAWCVLCRRLIGSSPAIGVTLPARAYPELADVAGPLDRTAPCHLAINRARPFDDVVRAVEQWWRGAADWQDAFAGSASDSGPDRVYDYGFAHVEWQPGSTGWTHAASGARLIGAAIDLAGARTALLSIVDGDRATLAVQFDARAIEPAAIRRLAATFGTLLADAANRPAAAIDDLALLSAAERTQIEQEWNVVDETWCRDRASLMNALERQAARSPDAIAVSADGMAVSYRMLHTRANGLAWRLAEEHGVGPDVEVAVCLEPGPALVEALLAVWKAGGAYVPLDPRAPLDRLQFIIDDARTTVLIGSRSVDSTTAPLAAAMPRMRVLRHDEDHSIAAPAPPRLASAPGSEDEIAYVIYTSGSTGRPKGVAVTRRNVAGLFAGAGERFELTPEDVWTFFHSAAFDFSVWEIWGALRSGGRLVIVSPAAARAPAGFYELVRREQVTVLSQTPSAFAGLAAVDAAERAALALRVVIFGGEALDVGRLREWIARRGVSTPALINMYGITETTVHVTHHGVAAGEDGSAASRIGRPLPGFRCYVLDDAGQPAPLDMMGELYVGGTGVSRGYVGRVDLTAARFVPDPFGATPGARLYRSGDRARWRSDGTLEYGGRFDDQVKLRGYRIEPAEIAAVLRTHHTVRDAAVTLREDRAGDPRLVAYVVPTPGHADDAGEWRRHLRGVLPEYMTPAALVVLDRLPLTSNGKLDRRRLPAPPAVASSGALASLDATGTHAFTPIEEIVAGVWAEVLGLERVGPHDEFLALGGHSLNAVQVLARLRDALGREIALDTVLGNGTPTTLAREIERQGGGPAGPALEPIGRAAAPPLSFGQERLWIVDRVTGTRAYHVPIAVRVTGPLNGGALAAALAALATRHEVLRTTIDTNDTIGSIDTTPVQRIHPPSPVPLPWVDLQGLRSAAQEAAQVRAQRQVEGAPFDLRRGPLWRAAVVRLGPERHLFCCTLHHIVSDGWSVGVLLRDLSALYESARTREAARIPALPVQYGDYAAWQRRMLDTEGLRRQLEYWRGQLAGATPLSMPTDWPRAALRAARGGIVWRRWSPALTVRVRQFARARGATVFMVLLAAWQALLARHSGSDDIPVGIPVAQRLRPELEDLIGFFLNTIVIRTRVDASASWQALVAQVRASALGAYAHQLVPFEQVIAHVLPQRDLARTPLFQVMFIHQNMPSPALPRAGDVQFEPHVTYERVPKYEQTLYAVPGPDGLSWALQYDAGLFRADTMQQQMAHLERLVEQALGAPEAPLGTLTVLDDAEQRQIVSRERSETRLPQWPIEQAIGDRFASVATNHADAIAVKTPRAAWTYRDLADRARAVARAVERRADAAPSRVLLLCGQDERMLAAVMGTLRAGHIYVPLDPRAPLARLRQLREDAMPAAILTDMAHHGAAAEIADGLPIVVMDDLTSVSAHSRRLCVPPDRPAYILYTSGSTGQPKGVVQDHRNVMHFARAYARSLRLRPADKVTLLPSYGADAGVMDIFAALLTGATLYPIDLRETPLTVVADWIDSEGITVLHATPTVFRLLTHSLRAGRVLSTVRMVVLGGEAAYRTDVEAFERHFAPGCELINGLGPTESTMALQERVARGEAGARRYLVPAGYPVEGTTVRLLDERGVDADIHGEIAVESPHVAREYWRRPDLTRQAFADVTGPGGQQGWRRYRTGDLGRRLPDGRIEFLGRKDRQIKIRGYRVEPGEIEAVLASHPAVCEAVVSRVEDADGRERLVAYVVPREPASGSVPASTSASNAASPLPEAELRALAASRLPEYMAPSAFVTLDALPLRANGKVDTDALPRPPALPAAAEAYAAPITDLERALADVWSQVLHVSRAGRHDSFFELGGDSIRAIQCAIRARDHGIPLTPLLLFQHPVLADLASVLADRRDRSGSLDPEMAISPAAIAASPPEPVAAPVLTPAQLAHLSSRVQLEG